MADNVREEGEGPVYETDLGSDAKEVYHSPVAIPDGDARKENTYFIHVGPDVKQLEMTVTDGVVSDCAPGGYANTCNVSIGHRLISANGHDIAEISYSEFLEVLQSRPLKLIFSKLPVNVSV